MRGSNQRVEWAPLSALYGPRICFLKISPPWWEMVIWYKITRLVNIISISLWEIVQFDGVDLILVCERSVLSVGTRIFLLLFLYYTFSFNESFNVFCPLPFSFLTLPPSFSCSLQLSLPRIFLFLTWNVFLYCQYAARWMLQLSANFIHRRCCKSSVVFMWKTCNGWDSRHGQL